MFSVGDLVVAKQNHRDIMKRAIYTVTYVSNYGHINVKEASPGFLYPEDIFELVTVNHSGVGAIAHMSDPGGVLTWILPPPSPTDSGGGSTPTPSPKPKCECGASFTTWPNDHMSYCPMYKAGE